MSESENNEIENNLRQLFSSSDENSNNEISRNINVSYSLNDVLDQMQAVNYDVDEIESILTGSTQTGPQQNESTLMQGQTKSRNWEQATGSFIEKNFEDDLMPSKDYSNKSQLLDYFRNLFPEQLLDLIVQNTNLYAKQNGSATFVDVSYDELCAFFGMVILMGLHPLPSLELYWSTDEFYGNPVIQKVMTCKRFKKILENLHVCNNDDILPRSHPGHDKLSKIKDMIIILNRTFSENATQSKHQSIDESMIKFKGRSSIKQYMPKKPIKRGYKVWARCDSKTGYLYNFDIYKGKTDNKKESIGLGHKVVLSLCEEVPQGTLLAFDNFFSSLPLLDALCERGLFCVCTFRVNRVGIPSSISEKPTRKIEQLKPGEFKYEYDSPISVIKWHDSKDVFVMTNAFDPREVQIIQRTQKDGTKKDMYCPKAIVYYTKTMGGVDKFDHLKSSYPIGRRSYKSWHRIFWYLLDAAVINSYILYRYRHDTCAHRDFRLRLGRALINNYSSRQRIASTHTVKKRDLFGVPKETRLSNVGLHMPIPTTSKRCKFCSTRAAPKRTSYMCRVCRVPICIYPCFELFHRDEQFIC